jgi:hypothetical protein
LAESRAVSASADPPEDLEAWKDTARHSFFCNDFPCVEAERANRRANDRQMTQQMIRYEQHAPED